MKVFDDKLSFLSFFLNNSVEILDDNSLKTFSACPPTLRASITKRKSLSKSELPTFFANSNRAVSMLLL